MQKPQSMPESTRLVTADELEHMPGDDCRYELVEGRLIKMRPVGYQHGRIVVTFGAMLHRHVNAGRLGDVLTELGCKLASNPDTVRAPDLAFIRRERLPTVPRGFWKGPPDLAVEVLSPDDRPSAIREKVGEYLARGVLVVLVIDPDERTVVAHRRLTPPIALHEDDDLDLDDVVTGFRCRVREIFA